MAHEFERPPLEDAFASPEMLIVAATNAVQEQTNQDPIVTTALTPEELAAMDTEHQAWFSEEVLNQEYQERQNRALFNARVGKVLAEYIHSIETPEQFQVATAGLTEWLVQCGDSNRVVAGRRMGVIQLSDLRTALIDKVVDSGWINNYQTLWPVLESLRPLFTLDNRIDSPERSVLREFRAGSRPTMEKALREFQDNTPKLHERIVFLSALTDAEMLDEKIWGIVGIRGFHQRTPVAVTEELHRRLIQEHRDAYWAENEREHGTVLQKYCGTILRRVIMDETRDAERTRQVAANLEVRPGIPLIPPYQRVNDLANGIGAAYNSEGGMPDENNARHPLEPLTAYSRAAWGEAMRRILYFTRPDPSAAPEHYARQAYEDSLYVGIVHELGVYQTARLRPRGPGRPPGRL